jgi:sirohydrochlorin cobaltochelatase
MSAPDDSVRGIVLFGHGARNPEWAAPFHQIRQAMLRREPTALIELGFLEAMQPTLDQAIDALVASGARQISIVPVFIATGAHIARDLPQLAAAAMERHVHLEVDIAAPVGQAPSVVDAIADYALQPIPT